MGAISFQLIAVVLIAVVAAVYLIYKGYQALFSKILHDELQHLDELDKMSISLSTKEKLRG